LRTDVHSKMHVRTSGLLAGSNPAFPTSYNKDLTDFQKENPKCPSDTSLNPDIMRNFSKRKNLKSPETMEVIR